MSRVLSNTDDKDVRYGEASHLLWPVHNSGHYAIVNVVGLADVVRQCHVEQSEIAIQQSIAVDQELLHCSVENARMSIGTGQLLCHGLVAFHYRFGRLTATFELPGFDCPATIRIGGADGRDVDYRDCGEYEVLRAVSKMQKMNKEHARSPYGIWQRS